jgi:hypothetical protein
MPQYSGLVVATLLNPFGLMFLTLSPENIKVLVVSTVYCAVGCCDRCNGAVGCLGLCNGAVGC